MGFDEPKPFVYATRDFGEHISGISMVQLVRLTNGLADFASEGGKRFGNGFDVRVTVGNVEGILFQARAHGRLQPIVQFMTWLPAPRLEKLVGSFTDDVRQAPNDTTIVSGSNAKVTSSCSVGFAFISISTPFPSRHFARLIVPLLETTWHRVILCRHQ